MNAADDPLAFTCQDSLKLSFSDSPTGQNFRERIAAETSLAATSLWRVSPGKKKQQLGYDCQVCN